LLVTQDGADGLGDVCRRKNSKRHLVEQWLKCMVVSAIDHSHIDRHVSQRQGRVETRKACTYDHHMGTPPVLTGLKRFCQFAH
jgi:hypothetical protein